MHMTAHNQRHGRGVRVSRMLRAPPPSSHTPMEEDEQLAWAMRESANMASSGSGMPSHGLSEEEQLAWAMQESLQSPSTLASSPPMPPPPPPPPPPPSVPPSPHSPPAYPSSGNNVGRVAQEPPQYAPPPAPALPSLSSSWPEVESRLVGGPNAGAQRRNAPVPPPPPPSAPFTEPTGRAHHKYPPPGSAASTGPRTRTGQAPHSSRSSWPVGEDAAWQVPPPLPRAAPVPDSWAGAPVVSESDEEAMLQLALRESLAMNGSGSCNHAGSATSLASPSPPAYAHPPRMPTMASPNHAPHSSISLTEEEEELRWAMAESLQTATQPPTPPSASDMPADLRCGGPYASAARSDSKSMHMPPAYAPPPLPSRLAGNTPALPNQPAAAHPVSSRQPLLSRSPQSLVATAPTAQTSADSTSALPAGDPRLVMARPPPMSKTTPLHPPSSGSPPGADRSVTGGMPPRHDTSSPLISLSGDSACVVTVSVPPSARGEEDMGSDLISFQGQQDNPLDWTSQFATPVFPSPLSCSHPPVTTPTVATCAAGGPVRPDYVPVAPMGQTEPRSAGEAAPCSTMRCGSIGASHAILPAPTLVAAAPQLACAPSAASRSTMVGVPDFSHAGPQPSASSGAPSAHRADSTSTTSVSRLLRRTVQQRAQPASTAIRPTGLATGPFVPAATPTVPAISAGVPRPVTTAALTAQENEPPVPPARQPLPGKLPLPQLVASAVENRSENSRVMIGAMTPHADASMHGGVTPPVTVSGRGSTSSAIPLYPPLGSTQRSNADEPCISSSEGDASPVPPLAYASSIPPLAPGRRAWAEQEGATVCAEPLHGHEDAESLAGLSRTEQRIERLLLGGRVEEAMEAGWFGSQDEYDLIRGHLPNTLTITTRLSRVREEIGLILDSTSGIAVIEEIVEGSAAAAEGTLRVGDVICGINGQPACMCGAVVRLLCAAGGSEVELTVRRASDASVSASPGHAPPALHDHSAPVPLTGPTPFASTRAQPSISTHTKKHHARPVPLWHRNAAAGVVQKAWRERRAFQQEAATASFAGTSYTAPPSYATGAADTQPAAAFVEDLPTEANTEAAVPAKATAEAVNAAKAAAEATALAAVEAAAEAAADAAAAEMAALEKDLEDEIFEMASCSIQAVARGVIARATVARLRETSSPRTDTQQHLRHRTQPADSVSATDSEEDGYESSRKMRHGCTASGTIATTPAVQDSEGQQYLLGDEVEDPEDEEPPAYSAATPSVVPASTDDEPVWLRQASEILVSTPSAIQPSIAHSVPEDVPPVASTCAHGSMRSGAKEAPQAVVEAALPCDAQAAVEESVALTNAAALTNEDVHMEAVNALALSALDEQILNGGGLDEDDAVAIEDASDRDDPNVAQSKTNATEPAADCAPSSLSHSPPANSMVVRASNVAELALESTNSAINGALLQTDPISAAALAAEQLSGPVLEGDAATEISLSGTAQASCGRLKPTEAVPTSKCNLEVGDEMNDEMMRELSALENEMSDIGSMAGTLIDGSQVMGLAGPDAPPRPISRASSFADGASVTSSEGSGFNTDLTPAEKLERRAKVRAAAKAQREARAERLHTMQVQRQEARAQQQQLKQQQRQAREQQQQQQEQLVAQQLLLLQTPSQPQQQLWVQQLLKHQQNLQGFPPPAPTSQAGNSSSAHTHMPQGLASQPSLPSATPLDATGAPALAVVSAPGTPQAEALRAVSRSDAVSSQFPSVCQYPPIETSSMANAHANQTTDEANSGQSAASALDAINGGSAPVSVDAAGSFMVAHTPYAAAGAIEAGAGHVSDEAAAIRAAIQAADAAEAAEAAAAAKAAAAAEAAEAAAAADAAEAQAAADAAEAQAIADAADAAEAQAAADAADAADAAALALSTEEAEAATEVVHRQDAAPVTRKPNVAMGILRKLGLRSRQPATGSQSTALPSAARPSAPSPPQTTPASASASAPANGYGDEQSQLDWALSQSAVATHADSGSGGVATGLSEDEQLALALSLSEQPAETHVPVPQHQSTAEEANDMPRLAQGLADYSSVTQSTQSSPPDLMTEDEQLAMALSLSLGDQVDTAVPQELSTQPGNSGSGVGDLSPDVPISPTGGAACSDEHGAGGGSSMSSGDSLRVRIVGSEQAGDERHAHVVYVLQIAGSEGAPETRRRFSSFLDLLSTLSREVGTGVERGSAAVAALESWKRHLTIEKRHTGKASRGTQVVNRRIKLLQRMLDELIQIPQIATSVGLAVFITGS